MIGYANLFILGFECTSSLNKSEMHIEIVFSATKCFESLKEEAKTLKQQLFWSFFG